MLPEDVINGIATQTGSQRSIDLGPEGCSDLKALMVILTCLFFWQICYFFFKNITFGFTLFLYEVYASFSGQPAYNDWFLSLYSVFFSSLPVIALGVLDQDVSARYCLKVSCVYHQRKFVSNSQALQMAISKMENISPSSFLASNTNCRLYGDKNMIQTSINMLSRFY